MQESKSLRIFIIENDHQTRVNLRLWFEENGHEVLSSANSREALRILEHIMKPDLILLGVEANEMFPYFQAALKLKDIPKACIIR